MRVAAAALAVLCVAHIAAAEPYIAQPVDAVDDTRSDGTVARSWLEIASDLETVDSVQVERLRLKLGPPTLGIGQARDLFGSLTNYALRVEADLVQFKAANGEQVRTGGPFTFAIQRFVRLDPIVIAPLVSFTTGVEVAVSTPWVDDKNQAPPAALRIVDGVDSELAGNGWSVRPLGVYLRGDFLACRADHIEVGLAPEAFVPQQGTTEYALRFHGDLGFSLACWHARDSFWRHVSLDAGYRGRVRLYADNEPVAYADQFSAAVQVDFTTTYIDGVFALLGAHSPGNGDWLIGLRVQFGFGGWFRRGR